MKKIKVQISDKAYNMLMAMEQETHHSRQSLLESEIERTHFSLLTVTERISPEGRNYFNALEITTTMNSDRSDWEKSFTTSYDPEYDQYKYEQQKLWDEEYNK
jgi:hypothetical protein